MNLSKNSILFTFIVLYYSVEQANGTRPKDKMYEKIDASKQCFRRLNATHQIGCSSERGGSTGVIHYCTNQEDLDFVLKNGSAPPYVPVMPTKMFTAENVNKLKTSKKISGVLLYATNEKLSHFSHENQCPNPLSSLKDTCGRDRVWNPYGTGLLYQDIPFPVFYVETEETITTALKCYNKHNNFSFDSQRDRSLCSLQLISFMYATTDSPTCIRRTKAGDVTNINPIKFCDPLGDQNIWASLFPLVNGTNYTKPITGFKYIIVAARMDTTSMFDKTAGAISPVTGLVTLISTAKYLKKILPTNNNYTKNVLFLLFNGESYDYIGSQRFVYELSKGNFPSKSKEYLPPITIDDIDLFIELSQLNKTETVVAHYSNDSKPSKFLLTLNSFKGNLNLDESETLPPASLHTFLKERHNISGLILADHKNYYSNMFYNSLYDNATNLNYRYLNITENSVFYEENIQTHIQKISTMVAKSIYREITGQSYHNSENSQADLQFIDELFHCYLENANCKIHQAVQRMQWQQKPFSLYVGVVETSSNIITSLIGLTLGWVTGDVTGESNINCTNKPRNYALRYYNMSSSLDDLNKTLCYRITMNFTEAISPAFIIDDYDWSSGKYSSWTESTWGDIQLRIFLKPSAAHENMTIAIGSIVLIFSLIFVYFVKSRSDILFTPQTPTLAPTNC